ncbi:NAD(P)-binding protein [Amniculicola lignicola CBS 123094]|uniref:NAD(P)-binding protein n=1 Tax=Amniculicola lignicola CBS 123094 TaxID=1392246 RepID=A0A6A5W5J0_9PLEO|nr:NAD(P)-binding protein [Amniculicola lignicola CBS 123094]
MPYGYLDESVPRGINVAGSANVLLYPETAAPICITDSHIYRGAYSTPGPANPPTILGHEAMGVVSEIGSAITPLNVGDDVVIPGKIDNTHLSMEPQQYIPFDYFFLPDIFPMAWPTLHYSAFRLGDTVAIFGAGPVGLLATYSASPRGASKVYSADSVPSRLALAESIGAISISLNASDLVQQILAQEPGGIQRAVDCVGYEGVNSSLLPQTDTTLQQMTNLTARYGGIGIAGVYGPDTNMNPDLPPLPLFSKAISVRMGAMNPLLYPPLLENLVTIGKVKPNFIVSTQVGIGQAPEMYRTFNEHR